jgi:hypothetical protein
LNERELLDGWAVRTARSLAWSRALQRLHNHRVVDIYWVNADGTMLALRRK